MKAFATVGSQMQYMRHFSFRDEARSVWRRSCKKKGQKEFLTGRMEGGKTFEKVSIHGPISLNSATALRFGWFLSLD